MTDPSEPAPSPTIELSVIIPYLNAADTIETQLTAVFRQSIHQTFEVLVVDNGSNDDTREVVSAFIAANPEIGTDQVVLLDGTSVKGSAHARNVGARRARGKWLAFCDADDVVDEHWLERLFAAASTGTVVGGALRTDQINPPRSARSRPRRPSGRLNTAMGFLPFVPTGNMLVSAADFSHLGGLSEQYRRSHDVEFSWRAQIAGFELVHAPDAIVDYRYRDSGAGAFRQGFRSGRATVQLYADFRAHGVPPRPVRHAIRQWIWLTVRTPYAFLPMRRLLWFRLCGEAVGRLAGSFTWRVNYL